jgi:hypothetical protein
VLEPFLPYLTPGGDWEVTVAEFLINALEVDPEKRIATTDVGYDTVGPGTGAWRVERSGLWRMRWR